jgi:hypothetical protein
VRCRNTPGQSKRVLRACAAPDSVRCGIFPKLVGKGPIALHPPSTRQGLLERPAAKHAEHPKEQYDQQDRTQRDAVRPIGRLGNSTTEAEEDKD